MNKVSLKKKFSSHRMPKQQTISFWSQRILGVIPMATIQLVFI
jgi:hypothetical protein